jgi:Zn-dependent alcohol dehydrogenase
MGTEFKAAVLTGIGEPLEVMDLKLMDTISEGQVLIQLVSASVCGSQILEIAGAKGNSVYVPHLLGHEGFGQVLEVGRGVRKVASGDSVVLHWRRSEGLEAENPSYLGPNGMSVRAGKVATFSSLSVVSENRLTKVNSNIDPELATLFGCGLSTGMAATSKQAGIGMGSTILILGAGGIGLSVCLGARALGVSQILVVDKDRSKESRARGCGATKFFDSIDNLRDYINMGFSPAKFDAVFETTGSRQLAELSLSFTRDSGTVVQLGQSNQLDTVSLGLQKEAFGSIEGKTIVFSQGGGFNPDTDLEKFIDQITSDKFRAWTNLLGPKLELSQVNELIHGLKSGIPGRPILIF